MKKWWDDNEQPAEADPANGRPWQLRLYVAGSGRRAEQARTNVQQCCERHFAGCYELEVIDLLLRPELAQRDQVLALPLLVRRQPAPCQHLIGTLADEAGLLRSLLAGLDC